MIERTNDDWLGSLGGVGQAADAALRDLREFLRRALRRALVGRGANDDGFLDDAAQEGTLKVLAGLATFRGDSRFTTWAIAVATRAAFTKLRRARWRDVSLDQLVANSPGRQPVASPDPKPRDDARSAVLATLHRVMQTDLTDRQRVALAAELKEAPLAEIAAQLGLTRNALYKLTHDARQNLKLGLEAAGIGAEEVREAFDL